MAESSPKDKKTLWEKEKLLVTSLTQFEHSMKLFLYRTVKVKYSRKKQTQSCKSILYSFRILAYVACDNHFLWSVLS